MDYSKVDDKLPRSRTTQNVLKYYLHVGINYSKINRINGKLNKMLCNVILGICAVGLIRYTTIFYYHFLKKKKNFKYWMVNIDLNSIFATFFFINQST